MTTPTTTSLMMLVPSLEAAWRDVDISFERFCLTAGIGAIEQMLCEDAQRLTGPRHRRVRERAGHRRGTTKGPNGGMSRALLNSAGWALPIDDAMRLAGPSQVSVWSRAWPDEQPTQL